LDADDGTGRTRGKRLAEVLVTAALKGDVRAIALVFDRVDGRAPATADDGGADDDIKAIREHLDPARFRRQEGACHDPEHGNRPRVVYDGRSAR
jgi:hypothetical protein